MAIIITDDDARRHLSMKECIEAMRVAFRDYALGDAITLPRVRYRAKTPDPDRLYMCNVHVGAVPSYGMACVRAGSNIIMADSAGTGRKMHANPEGVNWSVIVLYDLATAEPLAFLHESHLSGFRVGATTGAAVDAMARADARTLGLFGNGRQARGNFQAILEVRPIELVRLYSPNEEHCGTFAKEMARDGVAIEIVRDARAAVEGADIVCCATNTTRPVFEGDWLEPGQMLVTIVNSDVTAKRTEADETVFARATDIVVNDWASVLANEQTELLDPIGKGLVDRDRVVELGDVLAGRAEIRQTGDNLVYYKNNTGLGMQFAAAGAVIYGKMKNGETNRVVPREWLAAEKYTQG
jgi:ornithine cyclodeaminase/alanine dehydrogenase-like protein (mu-crystallin family)